MTRIEEIKCDDCRYLEPKEAKQQPRTKHKCTKYDKVLKHLGRHPRPVVCDEYKATLT